MDMSTSRKSSRCSTSRPGSLRADGRDHIKLARVERHGLCCTYFHLKREMYGESRLLIIILSNYNATKYFDLRGVHKRIILARKPQMLRNIMIHGCSQQLGAHLTSREHNPALL